MRNRYNSPYLFQAQRWFTILFVAALTQGLLAHSPIPALEDEWAEFSATLRNPAFRLPTTTRPRHYEFTITPYFDIVPTPNIQAFTFDGSVIIYLRPIESSGIREIVMHCNDLTIQTLTLELNGANVPLSNNTFVCEMPYSFLRIVPVEALQVNQEYIVRATYGGNIQNNMRGFYRSWYRDSTTNGTASINFWRVKNHECNSPQVSKTHLSFCRWLNIIS